MKNNKIIYAIFAMMFIPSCTQKSSVLTLSEISEKVLNDSSSNTIYSPTEWFSGSFQGKYSGGFNLAPNYNQDSCDQRKYIWVQLDSITEFKVRFGNKICHNGHRVKDTITEYEFNIHINLIPGTESTYFYNEKIIFDSLGDITYYYLNESKLDSNSDISVNGQGVSSKDFFIYKKEKIISENRVMHYYISEIKNVQHEDTIGEYVGITFEKEFATESTRNNFEHLYILKKEFIDYYLLKATRSKNQAMRALRKRYN